MPLPAHALTIRGGCSCHSIRYIVSIPPLASRPAHSRTDPSSTLEPVRLPYTFTDHCNDCRSWLGTILPAWITVNVGTVQAASKQLEDFVLDPRTVHDDDRVWWLGKDVFIPRGTAKTYEEDKGEKTDLKFYQSSWGVWRSFCGVCGTPLAYWSEWQPSILDLTLGSVDRDFLDTEDLRPERHFWWSKGIQWIKGWMQVGEKGAEGHVEDDMNERFRLGE